MVGYERCVDSLRLFLIPIYGYFIFALLYPFIALTLQKRQAEERSEDDASFYASMYQSMGEP